MIETTFTILLIIQFLVVALHDWLDIPGITHGRQVRTIIGPTKMIIGTLVNAALPGIAAALALLYWHKPKPLFVLLYWSLYCAMTALGAISSWWIPYFRGTDEKTAHMYQSMYAGTLHLLPPRGNNPRPNLLHLFFHALFALTLILSTLLWTGIS